MSAAFRIAHAPSAAITTSPQRGVPARQPEIADPEQDDREHDQPDQREPERAAAGVDVPLALLDRGRDARLERREPRGVRGPVRRDLLAELAQPLAVGVERRSRSPRRRAPPTGRAPRSRRPSSGARSATVSCFSPPHDLLLGVDGRRLVAAAPDQVEQRGRELVRAGRLVLAEERRDQRGLDVVGGACSYSRS